LRIELEGRDKTKPNDELALFDPCVVLHSIQLGKYPEEIRFSLCDPVRMTQKRQQLSGLGTHPSGGACAILTYLRGKRDGCKFL